MNVAYKLKEKQPLLDIGHTVAKQQFVVREYDCKAGFGLAASARPVEVTRWERGARVEGDTWQVFFSRDGFLAAYTVDGRELMAEGAELRPQFWRAPTRTTSGRGCTSVRPYGRTPNCGLRSSTLRSRTGWPSWRPSMNCPP